MLQNLTPEQAPPVSVPLRFFVVAPLFGVVAGLLLLFYGPDIYESRWLPGVVSLTHLLTLGFMGFSMCGAIMQMLPVLGGAVIPRVVMVGSVVHALLLFGTPLLISGFLWQSRFLMLSAALLLGTGFAVFIVVVAIALTGKKADNQTVSAMYYAMLALLVTVIFGIILVLSLASNRAHINLTLLTNIHLVWGMLGWVGLLLCGVAYQVVPMFQMTPRYPKLIRQRLVPLLFIGLLIWSGLSFVGTDKAGQLASTWLLVFVTGYSVFAIITIRLQQQRKRKIFDITRNFWMLGMTSILAASILWVVKLYTGIFDNASNFSIILGICLIDGFAVSVINGMLYRIVPFLIWFHLQHRYIMSAASIDISVPNVKTIIPVKRMKLQFGFHITAVLLLLAAAIKPAWFSYPAASVLTISFLLLANNLFVAAWSYWRFEKILNSQIAAEDGGREKNE